MQALLIDPFTRTVTVLDIPANDKDAVRAALGATTYAVDRLGETNHLVIGLGTVEQPGMRFWSFKGQDPIAGKALVRGNSPDGLQIVDTTVELTLLEGQIEWPAVAFERWQQVPVFRPLTDEERDAVVATGPGPIMGPANNQPQAKPEGRPWSIWTITEAEAGYTAKLVTVDGQGNAKHADVVLENEDLDELRSMLPQGLQKVERTKTDDPAIVESWVTPTAH
jgi:hypothetical protein